MSNFKKYNLRLRVDIPSTQDPRQDPITDEPKEEPIMEDPK